MRYEVHSHTMYSNIRLIDCINQPKELIKKASELGYCGITITDHESLSGHVSWLKAEQELKNKGAISQDFKCGLGNEIYLIDDRKTVTSYYHFILIAKNSIGHRALRELSSNAWYHSYSKRGMERVPTTKQELMDIVKKYPNSLIATSACLGNELGKLILEENAAMKKNDVETISKVREKISKHIHYCLELFGDDFYIEIAPSESQDQIIYNTRIVEIAKKNNLKIVIGTDAHYYTSAEREVHKAFLNSKDGEREVDSFYYYSHLMDDKEAFSHLKKVVSIEDYSNFCNNSIEIYNKIENYNIFHAPIIPRVEVPFYPDNLNKYHVEKYPILCKLLNSDNPQKKYWVNQCLEKLLEKNKWNDVYLSRLSEEADVLNVISEKLGNCMYEYFNTFQHYIDLFWECGSIVGPGRGSASCFLSNYLLGIVQIDPIQYDLPSFRFLNKERVELPNIKIK